MLGPLEIPIFLLISKDQGKAVPLTLLLVIMASGFPSRPPKAQKSSP